MRHPLLRHGHHLARRRTALPRAAVRDFRALARALPCRDGVGAASCAAAGAPECEPASLPPLSGSPTCFSFFLVGPARSKSAQTNPASYSAHCAPLRPLGPAPARGQRWCAPPSPRQGAPPGTLFPPSRVLSVPSPALRRRARPARALWPSRAVLRSGLTDDHRPACLRFFFGSAPPSLSGAAGACPARRHRERKRRPHDAVPDSRRPFGLCALRFVRAPRKSPAPAEVGRHARGRRPRRSGARAGCEGGAATRSRAWRHRIGAPREIRTAADPQTAASKRGKALSAEEIKYLAPQEIRMACQWCGRQER